MSTIAQKVSKSRTLQGVETVEYTVDAANRTLGRVAAEAASALLGKKSVHYVQNKVIPVRVTVTNIDRMSLPEKRVGLKTYRRYTGYPGGLREMTLQELKDKKGIAEAMRMAVDGMLPRNKLRKDRMKRLIIK